MKDVKPWNQLLGEDSQASSFAENREWNWVFYIDE